MSKYVQSSMKFTIYLSFVLHVYKFYFFYSISDVNECDPDPCLNGAVCVDGINGYTCICPAGYTGVNCETG